MGLFPKAVSPVPPTPESFEGIFTDWTLLHDIDLDTHLINNENQDVKIDNGGNSMINYPQHSYILKSDGTTLENYSTSGFNLLTVKLFDQSVFGLYQVAYDDTAHKIYVYKDHVKIKSITLDFGTKFAGGFQMSLAIAPSGAYILIVGIDFTNHAHNRVQIYKGA